VTIDCCTLRRKEGRLVRVKGMGCIYGDILEWPEDKA